MTRWEQAADATRIGVRLDRIFRAGPRPREAGEDFLWIIDYKTANHGGGGLDEFIAGERRKYQPQLEAYARYFTPTLPSPEKQHRGLRLALYYPALARLEWWVAETTAPEPSTV